MRWCESTPQQSEPPSRLMCSEQFSGARAAAVLPDTVLSGCHCDTTISSTGRARRTAQSLHSSLLAAA